MSPSIASGSLQGVVSSPRTAVYRYGLVMLFLVCTISYFDRQIVTILAEPLKRALHLSDTDIGLLTGFSFGIVYCTCGVPIARLADRVSRVGVLSASLLVWSVCTMACGIAPNFGALIAARVGVGIGEAGSIPTGLAMAADYAPREKRASALAFFAMGVPVGSLLGLALGGIMASAYGWRMAFCLAGIPGILLAVLILTTIRRSSAPGETDVAASNASNLGFGDVLRQLLPKRTFWFIACAAASSAFVSFGQAPFTAAFFLRAHAAELARLGAHFDLKPIAVLGIALGVLGGVCGCISNWFGGVIADHYARRDLRAFGTVPAVAALASIPFTCAAFLAPTALEALAFLIPQYLLNGLWFGPGLACIQSVVPRELRATASSIALFLINIAGFGFGALAVGALSDTLQRKFGLSPSEGVRWALVVSTLFGVVTSMLFWRARRHIRAEFVT